MIALTRRSKFTQVIQTSDFVDENKAVMMAMTSRSTIVTSLSTVVAVVLLSSWVSASPATALPGATAVTNGDMSGASGRSRMTVVLGSRLLFPGGSGWGTSEPRTIYNGGVPSGKAWRLVWKNWGRAAAFADGVTWIYRPSGGYFATPGRVQLKAYLVSYCSKGGRLAYTRLSVRAVSRPGGTFGKWHAWGGLRSICGS